MCSNCPCASGPSGMLDHEALREAARTIKRGGVIIAGTETFYCIAADASNESAVERVFRIKGREERNPLPLIAADQETLVPIIGEAPPILGRLMKTFWPGSLTILFEARGRFSRLITGPSGKIGIRVPPPCPACFIAEYADLLLTATSANFSGQAPTRSVGEIPERLTQAVDLVVDSGDTPGGMPSTVIECQGNVVRVLRQGVISEEEIKKALTASRMTP